MLGLIKQRRPFIRGIVYPLRRKCGKTVGRCQDGHLHESWVLSVPEQGCKRMRTVLSGKRLTWQSLADRYRRFRRARARQVKLFAAIIKLIDAASRLHIACQGSTPRTIIPIRRRATRTFCVKLPRTLPPMS